MKNFSVLAFSLSFVIALFSFLLKGSRFEEITKRAFSLILISFLLPFFFLLGEGIEKIPDFSLPEVSSSLDQVTKESLEAGLALAVCEEFDIKEENLRVVLVGFSAETVKAQRVSVFLSHKDVLKDQKAVKAFVEEQNIGPCEVIYES